jgi:hypothetical protein
MVTCSGLAWLALDSRWKSRAQSATVSGPAVSQSLVTASRFTPLTGCPLYGAHSHADRLARVGGTSP